MIAKLIATLFGIGHLRPAPGTWGSLAGAILFVSMLHVPLLQPVWVQMAALTTVIAVLGIWAAGAYGLRTGQADAPEVVIDEVAGQWISLFPVVLLSSSLPGWAETLTGFTLFRLFDIWKPGPIRWVDTHVHGGVGVMLDDVGAGLVAAACLAAIMMILG